MARATRPLISAGAVFGLGLGGFFDGILFHRILQLYNVLSARVPNTDIVGLEVNMFWDGLFHALTWIMTITGLAMLWRAVRNELVPLRTHIFAGSLLVGWGVFNLVEGIIDHYLLQIHHVVERAGLSGYDHLFLLSGFVFVLVGLMLIRRRSPAADE